MMTVLPYEKYCAEKYRHEKLVHPLLSGNEFMVILRGAADESPDELTVLANLIALRQCQIPACLAKLLVQRRYAIVVTDVQQRIEWVNHQFTRMTGYALPEIAGLRPTFLQGRETSLRTKLRLRMRMENVRNYNGQIVNYRKNGDPYLCQIRIRPLYNTSGELVNFIALENELPLHDH